MNNESALIDALVMAAKRHDDMLNLFTQALGRLSSEIVGALSSLKAKAYGGRPMFTNRVDSESGVQALIIKSNLTNKSHTIGTSVLNFQTAGLGYTPTNGALCGFVQVILSDGDYWDKIKHSKINPLIGMAAGMANREVLAGMVARSQQRIASIEDITREVLDDLWVEADNPNQWCRLNVSKQMEPIVIRDYVSSLLDRVYNPEYKEWAYKSG